MAVAEAEAEDVAQALPEARDVEHRRWREQRLSSRQPLQLNAATMFHRRQRLLGLGPTTTRSCLFTLSPTEDTSNEVGGERNRNDLQSNTARRQSRLRTPGPDRPTTDYIRRLHFRPGRGGPPSIRAHLRQMPHQYIDGTEGRPGRTSATQFPVGFLSEIHRASGLCGPANWQSLHRPLGRENRGPTHRAFSGDGRRPAL